MPNYLGQHFLKDPAVVKKIIDAINVSKGDTIIEIGPGRGALTIPLAELCNSVGAKFIAIEKDKRFVEALRKQGIEVMDGDILDAIKNRSIDLGDVKLVGNIPYYITGHLFRLISESARKPAECVFMIQREVADRLIAKPPKMNRLAASIQFWAEPKTIINVAKSSFSPPPEVDSTVIKLTTRKPQPDAKSMKAYDQAIHALFSQPRKMIINNLQSTGLEKDFIVKQLAALGVLPTDRPQNLTIENIYSLAVSLFGTVDK